MKLYLDTPGLADVKRASARKIEAHRQAIRQQTLPLDSIKRREMPNRRIENRMDWSSTPLFESLVNAETERRQPKLFNEKKGE
jgi:hypothetical protein